jgi:hypothetical protein
MIFDFKQTDFSNENYEKFSHKVGQTDLQRLTSLLQEFGAKTKLQLYEDSDRKTLVVAGDVYFDFEDNGEFIRVGAY